MLPTNFECDAIGTPLPGVYCFNIENGNLYFEKQLRHRLIGF